MQVCQSYCKIIQKNNIIKKNQDRVLKVIAAYDKVTAEKVNIHFCIHT